MPICRRLLIQEILLDLIFADESAGNSIAAKMAMMALTTSNSISVNPSLSLSVTRHARRMEIFAICLKFIFWRFLSVCFQLGGAGPLRASHFTIQWIGRES